MMIIPNARSGGIIGSGWRAVMRPAVACALLAMTLAACDTMRSVGNSVSSTVGGWVAKVPGLGPSGDAAADEQTLLVLPIAGVDWPGGQALAEKMAEGLRRANPNTRVAAQADGRSQTVAGRIEQSEGRGTVIWLEIAWDYRAPDGRLMADYRQTAVVDRAMFDAAQGPAIQLLASEVVPKVSAMIQENTVRAMGGGGTRTITRAGEPEKTAVVASASNPPVPAPPSSKTLPPATAAVVAKATTGPSAAPAPAAVPTREVAKVPVQPVLGSPLSAAWTNPVFVIKPVEGAPGDGNESLTGAIRQTMRLRDFAVTDDPRQAVFQVAGKVEISPPQNGRQHARIVWVVTTMNGGQVGRATQENVIPAGSLDAAWGQVAFMISNAAVDGIQELFGRQPTRRTAAQAPPSPPLPQVPGRGPPPPR